MNGYQVVGIALGTVLAIVALAFAIAAVGGIVWMLVIKLVAWIIGASVSWLTAYGIGFALVFLGWLVRGGK